VNDEEFASRLYSQVLAQKIHEYEDRLLALSPDEIQDELWRDFYVIFAKLRASGNSDSLMNVVRLVIQDTVSETLGIIDGTSPLGNEHLALELKSDKGEVLSGCLQDFFLSECEPDAQDSP
jgi:hypothetical protein